jgi:hypothetical protein
LGEKRIRGSRLRGISGEISSSEGNGSTSGKDTTMQNDSMDGAGGGAGGQVNGLTPSKKRGRPRKNAFPAPDRDPDWEPEENVSVKKMNGKEFVGTVNGVTARLKGLREGLRSGRTSL